MGWVEILPAFESLFQRHGMESASAFLDWTGIVVNRHRHRQVERVTLESNARFYLKTQAAVTWRERFRNAWDGFGWCATAVREGAMLQALARAGVGCPQVAALGEHARRAFVLLREADGMRDLRVLLQELDHNVQRRLATSLGRELARMHDAGFDHPDLFAKHILADNDARLCIIDWQRGRHRRSVSWRLRCRDLAMLDATLHDALASDRLRMRCLRAYHGATHDTPPLGRLARVIRAQAMRLRESPRIREVGQLPIVAGDQELMPLRGERLLAVRSFVERCPHAWLQMTEHATHVWDLLAAFACMTRSEKVSMQSWPATSEPWQLPELAHTLFRLQRFGVAAPRVLAAGCDGAKVHVLTETPRTVPFVEAIAKVSPGERARLLEQAGAMVRQIHDASYFLPADDTWERRLGVALATGQVVLTSADSLPRSNRSWQELAPVEFNRSSVRLTRREQLRFMHGYLRAERSRERQAA